MTDRLLFLGDKNLSSWSLRAWLVLRVGEIPFREKVLPFAESGWRERIRSLSPSRRVPALHDGELVVWDSLAIAEYVAETFPEARLWPDDRRARALARAISAEMHSGFPNLRRDLSMDVVLRAPRTILAGETETEVRRVDEILASAREEFGRGGPFLFGAFSIADAMFAPMAFRFRTYDVAISAQARSWLEAMLDLPAMKEWERGAEEEVRDGRGRQPLQQGSAEQVFAVVFSSQLASGANDAYAEAAHAMTELAKRERGFLGIESARDAAGFGITVSYWSSLQAIRAWKEKAEHAAAQALGKTKFYDRYSLKVCSVERSYDFDRRVNAR